MKVARCACCILPVLICMVMRADGQGSRLRFPESRSYSPGELWLGWNSAERTGFVRGFIVGRDDSYVRGCMAAEANRNDSRKVEGFDPCLQQQHLFRKDVVFYERFVTDFYSRYATDRDVPIRVLLLQADEKTPDEVHEWLSKTSGSSP